MSLGGSKLEKPQRCSVVFSNTKANAVHVTQAVLCHIKAKRAGSR